MKAKQKRVKGPASRVSVRADTKLKGVNVHKPAAIRSREEQIVLDKRNMVPISNEAMMADTFNVIHTRICLNDGMSTAGDDSLVREKLFEIIAVRGWESTFRVMASCARLFAEVPSPVPPLSEFSKKTLHGAAQALDAKGMELRHVDREATKGHKI